MSHASQFCMHVSIKLKRPPFYTFYLLKRPPLLDSVVDWVLVFNLMARAKQQLAAWLRMPCAKKANICRQNALCVSRHFRHQIRKKQQRGEWGYLIRLPICRTCMYIWLIIKRLISEHGYPWPNQHISCRTNMVLHCSVVKSQTGILPYGCWA